MLYNKYKRTRQKGDRCLNNHGEKHHVSCQNKSIKNNGMKERALQSHLEAS